MKRLIFFAALAAGFPVSVAACAGEQTVKLAVENMTCASCPYIVKKTLAAVPGVSKVEVSLETESATVTFDDRKTITEALIAATTNAGYPARLAAGELPKTQ